MKAFRLVTGILSIILSLFVFFQSSMAGLANPLQENGEVGGSAGMLVAILLLAGGIVSIVTSKGGRGGSITTLIIFLLASFFGFSMAGSYADLNIWAGWCAFLAFFSLISTFMKKKE